MQFGRGYLAFMIEGAGWCEQTAHCLTAQLTFGYEPAHRSRLQSRLPGGGAAAGHQDDLRRLCQAGESLGHSEAVDVRQSDIEQDDVRAQPEHGSEGIVPGRGLTNHVESVGLE